MLWYVPAIVIPGKIAYTREQWAIDAARSKNTVVYGDDKTTIVHDFRL